MHPLLWLACVALLVACGGPTVPPSAAVDPNAPLLALPECSEPPAGVEEPPEGFIAPEGAIVQDVTPQGPLTNVTGYMPATPGQVRVAYEGLEGITVFQSEDEIFEAELLVSDGEYRTYVKATAACQRGSFLLGIVAPEVDAQGLPVPKGAQGAPPAPAPGATAAPTP